MYVTGTYYFAPTNGFALHLTSAPGATPRVAFTAVTGRTYTIQGGEELTKLSPLNFRLVPFGTNAGPGMRGSTSLNPREAGIGVAEVLQRDAHAIHER